MGERPGSNGAIPETSPDDIDAGPLLGPLFAQPLGESTVHEVAEALAKLIGSSGGGDGAPPPGSPAHKSEKRKDRSVQVLIGLIISAVSLFGAYKLTEARSLSNEDAIKVLVPKVEENAAGIQAISGDVKDLEGTIDQAMEVQRRVIVPGIEQLKEEAKTAEQRRLEQELREAKRELREARRRGR